MTYADRLRAAREREGMTQCELGEALGVSGQSISNWERGKTSPRVRYQKKLYDLLGVEPPGGTSNYEKPARGWGRKLRAARKREGWTQEELAEKVGAAPNTPVYWESGDCMPQRPTRLRLAALLGLDPRLTTEEALTAARDALLSVHEKGTVDYEGPTASQVLWAHTGGDWDRWAAMCREAMKRAAEIEPDIGTPDSGREAA